MARRDDLHNNSASTTDDMGTKVYHEKQVAALCGVHALNTLLQGPYFNEVQLAEIGQELDAREREVMLEAGMESEDFIRFCGEDSGNVARDGNFSMQVLSLALARRNMTAYRLNAPDPEAVMAASNPLSERAFICNLDQHWFTILKVDGTWWNCNSLNPAPEHVSDTYLDAFLHQLRMERYTIFFIRCAGQWPSNLRYGTDNSQGKWWTAADAAAATAAARKTRVEGRNRSAAELALERARGGTMTLRSTGPLAASSSGFGDADDPDLAAALQASLFQVAGGGGGSSARASSASALSASSSLPDGVDLDDPELAMALAASLEAAGAGSKGAGAAARPTRSAAPPPSAAAAGPRQMSVDFEDDLQRAIQASMQEAGPSAAGGAGAGVGAGAGAGGGHAGSKRPASSSPDREDEAPEAAPASVPVPDEPEAGSADAFELAIRLPDGQRMQRRFAGANTEVAAFCSSKGADMRRFRLSQQSIPGSPQQPLEAEQALQASGLPRRCALICVPGV